MDKYSFAKWDVELIQEPRILLDKLKIFNLKGRKIKSIRIPGYAYEPFDSMQDITWTGCYGECSFKKFEDDCEFKRYVAIDGLLIITFEDGDRFEIEYSDGSTLKIGLSSLPENIEDNLFIPNANMNIIFSNCLGECITGFEITMQSEPEMSYYFTEKYGYVLPDGLDAYIGGLKLLLTNRKSIVFKSSDGYSEIYCEDNEKIAKIAWSELKHAIIEPKKNVLK
ncbi:MAG: hypothetical protein MJ171_00275 [Clostridia bacterium]|nr:hypothetical protein [Clostridia bacterium]